MRRLKTVFDPEIPVNIYDLGLIYKIDAEQAQGGLDVADRYDADDAQLPGRRPDAGDGASAVARSEGLRGAKVESGLRSAVGPLDA